MNRNNEHADDRRRSLSRRARGVLRSRGTDHQRDDANLPAKSDGELSSGRASSGRGKSTAKTVSAVVAALVPLVTPMLRDFVNDPQKMAAAMNRAERWLGTRGVKENTAKQIVQVAEKAVKAAVNRGRW